MAKKLKQVVQFCQFTGSESRSEGEYGGWNADRGVKLWTKGEPPNISVKRVKVYFKKLIFQILKSSRKETKAGSQVLCLNPEAQNKTSAILGSHGKSPGWLPFHVHPAHIRFPKGQGYTLESSFNLLSLDALVAALSILICITWFGNSPARPHLALRGEALSFQPPALDMLQHAQLLSRVQLFVAPWTVARQAPLSMEFSRQEYWSGLPFPPPGDLPNPGIEPASPALESGFFITGRPGKSFGYIQVASNSPRLLKSWYSPHSLALFMLLFSGKSTTSYPDTQVRHLHVILDNIFHPQHNLPSGL